MLAYGLASSCTSLRLLFAPLVTYFVQLARPKGSPERPNVGLE